MSVLIVASTVYEIAPLMERYPDLDYLITGVGIPAAFFQIMTRLEKRQYSQIVQVGVAGSYDKKLNIGEVVVVKSDCFGDCGLLHNDQLTSYFELGLADGNAFPFATGELINPESFDFFKELKSVKGVTVNLMSTQSFYIELLQTTHGGSIETLEGAVLHYICLLKNISFFQIRGISNYVGERDKTKWDMNEAILKSNQVALNFLHKIRNT
jgi:futalosine hydrolase